MSFSLNQSQEFRKNKLLNYPEHMNLDMFSLEPHPQPLQPIQPVYQNNLLNESKDSQSVKIAKPTTNTIVQEQPQNAGFQINSISNRSSQIEVNSNTKQKIFCQDLHHQHLQKEKDELKKIIEQQQMTISDQSLKIKELQKELHETNKNLDIKSASASTHDHLHKQIKLLEGQIREYQQQVKQHLQEKNELSMKVIQLKKQIENHQPYEDYHRNVYQSQTDQASKERQRQYIETLNKQNLYLTVELEKTKQQLVEIKSRLMIYSQTLPY